MSTRSMQEAEKHIIMDIEQKPKRKLREMDSMEKRGGKLGSNPINLHKFTLKDSLVVPTRLFLPSAYQLKACNMKGPSTVYSKLLLRAFILISMRLC